jgi:type IV pilus assembly protein PilM
VFRKQRTIVGLDIGSSAIKAAELKPTGKGYRVAAFGVYPVPPDAIVDGAIIDGVAVADAIRALFEQNKGFKSKDVCASVSGNAVIVKKITLPVMTPTELDDSISWEAEQYIPFDVQDVNLDYQILDPGTGPESRGTMDVLLVAAKKGLYRRHRAGRAYPVAGRRRRVRAAERLRGELRAQPQRGRRAHERGCERDQREYPAG